MQQTRSPQRDVNSHDVYLFTAMLCARATRETQRISYTFQSEAPVQCQVRISKVNFAFIEWKYILMTM